MTRARLHVVPVIFLLASFPVWSAPVITILSPADQAFVNTGGGPPATIDVTFQVTGNTCGGGGADFAIVPYVNGVPVLCSGAGCGCTFPDQCNNTTFTITLDGSAFSSCMNTIQLVMDPPPRCPVLCLTPCSPKPQSNTVAVWQSKYSACTQCTDCNKSTVGRPVDVATGRMFHAMTDLTVQDPLPIVFARRYDNQSAYNGPLGFGWQHSYSIRLEAAGTGQEVFVDATGRRVYFTKNAAGGWDENRIEHMILTAPGTPAWRVTDKYQTKYEFDSGGKLTKIADRDGNALTFAYSGSNLTTITDPFSRSVTLNYSGGLLQTLVAGSRTVTYTYSGGNLTRVDYPDSSFVTYEYTDSNDAHNLTAARDALNHVIESHTYDTSDRVRHTESDGGNYAYDLTFDSTIQTTVTNSLGRNTVYTYDSFNGLVTSSTGPGCSSCGSGGTHTSLTYDRFLNLAERVDGRGIHTQWQNYDARGNPGTRIDAVGVAGLQRTWTFTYDPTYNFLATEQIQSVGTCSNTNRTTTNTYNSSTGDLLTQQVTGCAGTTPFSYTTTYTYDAHGQVKTVDGPRTDVSDITTTDYYADNDSDVNRRGRIAKVTDALSHATNYSGYDLFGNATVVVDPNTVETDFTFDARDRLLETRIKGPTTADDIVTDNHYDAAGRQDWVKRPTCVDAGGGCTASVVYGYDNVNRLTSVTDAAGNKIVSTYDTEGNRTREEYQDSSSVVQRFTNFGYDTYNRLQYVYYNAIVPENPGSVFSKFSYDDDGNRLTDQDPLGHVTSYTYDELNRLKTTTQTAGADTLLTTYGYDRLDGLTSVQDPNGYTTTYTNHDLGWQLTVASPDTGSTTNAYDPAGNLTSSTEARSVTATRTYDALNRLTGVSYPTSSLSVTYTYDSASVTFGTGRRTGMTDPAGSSVFSYDRRGLLLKDERTTGGATYTTQYGFDKNANRTQVLYPTAHAARRQGEADFTYDLADRVTLVIAKVNGSTATVAGSFTYKPFGPHTSVTFGNGLVDSRSYDSRYRIGTWTLTGRLSYTHTFNDDGNLTARVDNLNAANNRVFGYDGAHRLIGGSGPWGAATACTGSTTYTYDRNGNRLCKGETAPATNYSYYSSTNRLSATTGGEVASYAFDNSGNTTGDGTHTYQYGDNARLQTVDSGTTATYAYDGDGRRASKVASGKTTLFFYDPSGTLLTELVAADEAGKDYLFLGLEPLGRVDWGPSELTLGNVLRVTKSSPNVHLDWTLYPSNDNEYIVRRKQIVNYADKTFDGNAVISTVQDPTRTFDDPVLTDANHYEYEVFKRTFTDSLLYYHADHIGTPIAMTGSGGTFQWRAEHRPFGAIDSTPVNLVPNNLRFPGQFNDAETTLYQNAMRTYDLKTSRYRETDPSRASVVVVPSRGRNPGVVGFRNPYEYASANPVRFVDPLGLYSCTYHIGDHHMVCTPNDPTHPTFDHTDYTAGNNTLPQCPNCQNNPAQTSVPSHGPIPTGTYTIGPPLPAPHNLRRWLTPDPANTMFGRSGFQTHGCGDPATCSEGCIAATTNAVRDEFNRLMALEEGQNTLTVQP